MRYPFPDFAKEFPDEDTCLRKVLTMRYGENCACPVCGVAEPTFYRIRSRRAFKCKDCEAHIYPCAGTIFEKSRTPLKLWFHAMYMFTASRNGVAATELSRQLGVTYKCAWRMGHALRTLMNDVDEKRQLKGEVEVDETYVGGIETNKHKSKRTKRQQGFASAKTKGVVMGLLQRDGFVRCLVIPSAFGKHMEEVVQANVRPHARVYTDENRGYMRLSQLGYQHSTVMHSEKEYVRGKVYTNTLEGFWRLLKTGLIGTHVQVSRKHLQKYANEFAFRYNFRESHRGMFYRLISPSSQGE